MPHAETLPLVAPSLTAVLFGLSGCLVDFGARTRPHGAAVAEHAEVTPGALESLRSLQRQQIPCAWLDELPLPSAIHWPPGCRNGSNRRNTLQRSTPGRHPMPAGKR